MWNAIKAFLYWASSIIDITGLRWMSELRSMHKKYVEKGGIQDIKSIGSDFHKTIKKLKK